jgi:hypothetical protein
VPARLGRHLAGPGRHEGLARVENICQLRDAEALLVPELRRRLDPAERETLGRRLLERVGQLEGRPRRGW